jgi:hypothetical protein
MHIDVYKKSEPREFCPNFGQNLGKKNRAFSFYQARLPRIERGTYGLEVLDSGFVRIRKDKKRYCNFKVLPPKPLFWDRPGNIGKWGVIFGCLLTKC